MFERLIISFTVFLLVSHHATHGKVYHSLQDLPIDFQTPDFIVAGGGVGGSVVASRLSENADFNVLLIEAGPDPTGDLDILVPGFASRINATKYNWNFVSEPQAGLNGRSIAVPRGLGLGGTSLINGMVYTRGSKDDYDSWARLTGDEGWSWDALWPYILRNERWTPPAGGRDPSGQYSPEVHGYNGSVAVSLPWSGPTESDMRVLKNSALRGDEFPFVQDLNAGKPIGASWMQSTIGNGERSSASKSYLGPEVRERPNLAILLNTYVTRVLPVVSITPVVDIRKIELAPRAGGSTRRNLTAAKEVILSAGVYGTPQILLNSGIGNATEIEALGIQPLLDMPDVGEGLTEHVVMIASWGVIPPTNPSTPISPDDAWAMWDQNRTGPLTERHNHQLIWHRFPDNATLFEEFDDPSPGPTSPHIEMPIGNLERQSICLLTPRSRGSVKLRSPHDPLSAPLIDLNLLSHPFDMAALKEATRVMKRYFTGLAWDGYINGFKSPDPDTLTDEEFERSVRESAFTFWHPVGTARMSKGTDTGGVVDEGLRLKGAKGVRIVDASVIPYVPAAHTQAPTYILAERASDLIRNSWLQATAS